MHESKKLIPAENAPLPQLDRGTDYESVRRGFESLTAHHLTSQSLAYRQRFFLFLGNDIGFQCEWSWNPNKKVRSWFSEKSFL